MRLQERRYCIRHEVTGGIDRWKHPIHETVREHNNKQRDVEHHPGMSFSIVGDTHRGRSEAKSRSSSLAPYKGDGSMEQRAGQESKPRKGTQLAKCPTLEHSPKLSRAALSGGSF